MNALARQESSCVPASLQDVVISGQARQGRPLFAFRASGQPAIVKVLYWTQKRRMGRDHDSKTDARCCCDCSSGTGVRLGGMFAVELEPIGRGVACAEASAGGSFARYRLVVVQNEQVPVVASARATQRSTDQAVALSAARQRVEAGPATRRLRCCRENFPRA